MQLGNKYIIFESFEACQKYLDELDVKLKDEGYYSGTKWGEPIECVGGWYAVVPAEYAPDNAIELKGLKLIEEKNTRG